MAKVTIGIGKVLSEMFAGFDPARGNDASVCRIYSSEPTTCPLCRVTVKPHTLHECRKENNADGDR